MLIRCESFDRFRAAYPDRGYRREGASGAGLPEPFLYFDTEVDDRRHHALEELSAFVARTPDATAADALAFIAGETPGEGRSGFHISEDYAFCRRARAAGMKIWICPWVELTHSGNHRFASRLADLGKIGPV